jgi:FkbM family methyltransferase
MSIRSIRKRIPLSIKHRYWELLRIYNNKDSLEKDISVFGICSGFTMHFSPLLPPWIVSVRIRGQKGRLFFRPGTSDVKVIRQVFAAGEYSPLSGLPDVQTIVDCGANIGCTSAYLLDQYPKSRLIAIEPDTGNMALCKRNLRQYRDRVTFVQAGVWSTRCGLVVSRGEFRDGQPWSFQVRPTTADEKPEIQAITLNDLLAEFGINQIDILKIDVEGAEREIFLASDQSWLRRTRTIAIELHDQDCETSFRTALQTFDFDETTSGDLRVCKDIRSRTSVLNVLNTVNTTGE